MSDKLSVQDIIFTLEKYWAKQGCMLMQAYDNEKGTDSFLELLRSCNHDEDYTSVLCGFLQPFQPSGKGLGNAFGRKSERRLSIVYFLIILSVIFVVRFPL